MLQILKIELKRGLFRWQMYVAFILMVACLAQGFSEVWVPNSTIHASAQYYNSYIAFLYAIGQGSTVIFPGIFPLICVLVAGDSLAWDRRTGFERFVLMRTTYTRYIFGKVISVCVLSFGFVLVSELLAYVYAFLEYPTVSKIQYVAGITPHYSQNLFLHLPLVYVMLVIVNTALFALIISLMSLAISTITKNVFIVSGVPWIFLFLLQFAMYSIHYTKFAPLDLVGLYISDVNHYQTYEIPTLWVVVGILLVVSVYVLYTTKFKARSNYEG